MADITASDNVACKIVVAFAYSFAACSQYLLTALTIERWIIVARPYKQPTTTMHAIGYIFLIVVIMFLLFVPFLAITFDVVDIPTYNDNDTALTDTIKSTKMCTVLHRYSQLHTYFAWIDLTISFIIPLILILTSNIAIIFQLYQRSKLKHIQRASNKTREDVKIAYMLLTVSCFYIFCTTPNAVYDTLAPYMYEGPEEAFAPENIVAEIMTNMVVLHYSCNFFLYVASGHLFRNKLKQFFQNIFKPSGASDSSYNTSNTNQTGISTVHI